MSPGRVTWPISTGIQYWQLICIYAAVRERRKPFATSSASLLEAAQIERYQKRSLQYLACKLGFKSRYA